LAVIAVVAVSCSSESTRFADNPFSSRPSGDVTGSTSKSSKSSGVQSKPLPPPNTATMLPPPTRPAVSSTAGGGRGMASYQPGAAGPEVTGSVQQPQPQQAAARSGWTWEGGTPVTVAQGETADTLARRYGVPSSAILQANNLPNAAAIKPGQRLVIPRYEAPVVTGSAPPRPGSSAPAQPAPVIAAPATTGPYVHTVAPGETLMKISRQYRKPLSAIAKANNIAPHTMVKMGDRIVIPGMQAAAPVAQQKPAAAPPKIAAAPPTTARTITPANDNSVSEKHKPDTTASASMPTFRWPVRGRVITGFGPKPSGQQNDGINVAVPEGTPVKAAEDGVVAYAGNELKTYGNLVLVRHSNGYVTAYAHASEILVKRDEPIKRGQVIAKSGQTGNVSTPQLHFEIRKGSTPVDPMPFLDRGGST
jgi:murein DD-endopeptidase MepM/ murein hydrolase activator NlpD